MTYLLLQKVDQNTDILLTSKKIKNIGEKPFDV